MIWKRNKTLVLSGQEIYKNIDKTKKIALNNLINLKLKLKHLIQY